MRETRTSVRLIASALLLVTLGSAVDARPASAAGPTTGFQFAPRDRLFDSRNPATPLTPGVPQALTYGQRTIVNMTGLDATQPTWFYLQPCGQPVDRTAPAVLYVEPGEPFSNLVPVVPTSGCLTMFGDADLLIDLVGFQTTDPGLNYVSDAPPSELVPTLPPANSPTTEFRFPVRTGTVPANAEAVVLAVRVARGDAPTTMLECEPNGVQTVVAPNDGTTAANLMILPVAADGTACLRWLGARPSQVILLRLGYLAPGATPSTSGIPYRGFVLTEASGFVAVPPVRRFDTRDAGTPVSAGGVVRHSFDDLPLTATAVAVPITATRTTAPGFVTAYPCDAGARPEASNVNIVRAGQTVPNFAIVSLGSTAELCFFASAQTDVFVDIAGYYQADGGDGYVPATGRLLDTRDAAPIGAGTSVEIDLTGRVGADATAVALSVAATAPTGPGFLTVYPCGQTPPVVSNVNYGPGETLANSVTVGLPASKRICVFSPTRTDAIVDLAGWYAPSSTVGLLDEPPIRAFDTRDGGSPPLGAQEVLDFEFADFYLRAVAWNLTVTQTAGPGFVTGYPCAPGRPTTSNVNVTGAGQTVASFSVLPVDTARRLCLFTLMSTHLIADEAGVFLDPYPAPTLLEPPPTAPGSNAAGWAAPVV